MTDDEKKQIRRKIKLFIRGIAENSGCSYLNCHKNQWKDHTDNIHYLCDPDDMDEEYLNNCLGQIERDSGYIGLSFNTISKEADLESFNLSKKDKENIVNMAEEELEILFNEKKAEIEEELQSRE